MPTMPADDSLAVVKANFIRWKHARLESLTCKFMCTCRQVLCVWEKIRHLKTVRGYKGLIKVLNESDFICD